MSVLHCLACLLSYAAGGYIFSQLSYLHLVASHPPTPSFLSARTQLTTPFSIPTGSICERNGYLLIYPLNTDITWHSGKDSLKAYKFASKRVGHRFCPECGTSVCAFSEVPGFFDDRTALNVSTLIYMLGPVKGFPGEFGDCRLLWRTEINGAYWNGG
jgi:hypothetical protein